MSIASQRAASQGQNKEQEQSPQEFIATGTRARQENEEWRLWAVHSQARYKRLKNKEQEESGSYYCSCCALAYGSCLMASRLRPQPVALAEATHSQANANKCKCAGRSHEQQSEAH